MSLLRDMAFERFAQKVEFAGDCWLWTGAKNSPDHVYGQFRNEHMKQVQAHTFSYELFVGPIPDGFVPDHLCRNEACVSPWHLEPVTHQENMLRGAHVVPCVHGKRARSHCVICTRQYHRDRYRQLNKSKRTYEHFTEAHTCIAVSIANSLLKELDRCVAHETSNRSSVVRKALSRYLQDALQHREVEQQMGSL